MSRAHAVLLPIAALVTIVPAVIAGASPSIPADGEASSVERGEDRHDPEPASGAGAAAPPTTVDVVADREELLAAGRAVDAGGPDPGLQAALDAARVDASADGVDLVVSSHHRSAEEQLDALEREITERGSAEEALRWVFTPDRSMHVRGLAIDVGSGPAADWLQVHGGRFGLCKSLAWEWWHFEWRQRWQDAGSCPAPAASPAEAPPP